MGGGGVTHHGACDEDTDHVVQRDSEYADAEAERSDGEDGVAAGEGELAHAEGLTWPKLTWSEGFGFEEVQRLGLAVRRLRGLVVVVMLLLRCVELSRG